MLIRPVSAGTLQEAQQVFERVLEIAPGSVAARIGVAHALSANIGCGWSASPQEDQLRAERLLLEAIECDAASFRARYALGLLRRLQRHRPRPSDRWHLDEMVVRIAGERM